MVYSSYNIIEILHISIIINKNSLVELISKKHLKCRTLKCNHFVILLAVARDLILRRRCTQH